MLAQGQGVERRHRLSAGFAIALEKRFGYGILQTLDRHASLYFDYSIPLLEKLTAVAKLGVKEYFILYEQLRPKEPRELQKKAG